VALKARDVQSSLDGARPMNAGDISPQVLKTTPSRVRVPTLVFAGLTVLLFAAAVFVSFSFIAPLTWALMLAVLAQPVHRWIAARLPRPAIAAGLSVLAVLVVLALPTVFVVTEITTEAAQTVRSLDAGETMHQWRNAIERNPRLVPILSWAERHVDIRQQVDGLADRVMQVASGLMLGSAYAVFGWLVTFYFLFFFIRDKTPLLEALARWLPLTAPETAHVFSRVRDTLYAVAFGSFAVAVVQGTLAGLMFWFLGLPSPLMWGGIMAVFALMPVLGASAVWIPVAIYMALQGDWQKALILAGWGATAVALVDNLLYPMLVKGRLDLHPVPVFISVVGGVVAFGATGIVLGPLVLSLVLAARHIWQGRSQSAAVQASEQAGAS
jgi:predicted PurR-regulated permease PerM